MTTSQTEDVVGPLIGGPYNVSNSFVLYAAFKARFLALPRLAPEYFAHFANGSTLRGRVFAGTTNAGAGAFRLQVANGSEAVAHVPGDLLLNVTYTIVLRYDIDQAATTLWVNPILSPIREPARSTLKTRRAFSRLVFARTADSAPRSWSTT